MFLLIFLTIYSTCFFQLRLESSAVKSVRKSSENFGNGSKVIFRSFYDFLKFLEIFGKSSEMFRKTTEKVQK